LLAEAAQEAVDLRRSVQALERCRALREFRNELYRLQREQERFEKAQLREAARAARRAGAPAEARRTGPRVLPTDRERMAALARLRQTADRLLHLETASAALEDRAVLALHGVAPEEAAGGESVGALRAAWEEVLLTLYCREFPAPDRVTLALFGEEPGWLVELAGAFVGAARGRGLAVELAAYVLPEKAKAAREQPGGADPGREGNGEPPRQFWRQDTLVAAAADRVPEREILERVWVKDPDAFLAAPPARLPGLALRLRGPGAAPRFAPEHGLHLLRAPRLPQPSACLVEASEARLADYLPPPGVSRRGAVGTQPRRRTYDRGRELLDDALLGTTLPWPNRPLRLALAEAADAHLRRATLALLEE
jgi:hypothetical protein